MSSEMSEASGLVGVPATILTWLNYMNIMTMTPVLQFLVTLLSFVWLCIQIGGWVSKKLKKK
jgi:ABC-type proline/glycine betaine transport system permease subunit